MSRACWYVRSDSVRSLCQGCVCMFQFDCTNTLNDQCLENVTVHMETSDEFEVLKCIPCPSLPYDSPGTTYTLVRLSEDSSSGISGFWSSKKVITLETFN